MEKKAQTTDLLFGSGEIEADPILIELNNELIIRDINQSGAKAFFKKNRQAVLDNPLLDLLREQNINTKPFIKAFKLTKHSFFHIEHPFLKIKYLVTVAALHVMNLTHYSLTLIALNNSYHELKSYTNIIINNMPGAVYWKDLNGFYMGCNKFVAEMAGFKSPQEIIGKSDFDLCWHEFAEEWRILDRKVVDEGITVVREEQAKLANGKYITELTFKTPLRNQFNEIVGTIGTSLDISERKEMEAALNKSQIDAEAANFAKSEFIRNMEHQLRTPFSGVYSIVQMLYDAETDTDKKHLLEVTYKSAKEFLELLNKIIDFSRYQQDSSAVLCKKFDLKATLASAITMEKAASTIKNLTLTYSYPKELPTIFIGDPHRVQQLVLNILDNAIKFTNIGSVNLEIKLAKKIDAKNYILQIIVTDTGIGIDNEKQQFIFEKFYRLHPANQNRYKGAGVGLFVVKKIIDELEGEIDLISNLNKGTTFICTLPFKRPLLDKLISE